MIYFPLTKALQMCNRIEGMEMIVVLLANTELGFNFGQEGRAILLHPKSAGGIIMNIYIW